MSTEAATAQSTTSVATVVPPSPSGSLAPVGEQPPTDFMDTGESESQATDLQPTAIEATGM